MKFAKNSEFFKELPEWVPVQAIRYLKHTRCGLSLRDVARDDGCHASTVLRQVRYLEELRDDPLVDDVLESLGRILDPHTAANSAKGNDCMNAPVDLPWMPDDSVLAREARRILRRLCESGAVLALAPKMDKAVVLRSHGEGPPTRTAVVEREVAQAFALKDWIACASNGRVASYKITSRGRSALKRFLSEEEARRRSRVERDGAASPFMAQHADFGLREIEDDEDGEIRRVRCNLAESPLTMLARRRDKSGRPFLSADLVQAGERFREDFELAQMGPRVAQNWDRFLTSGDRGGFMESSGLAEGPAAARKRVLEALDYLGSGLGDIVMRCCCFLEGLEAAEKRMGWSARSGKIVLRIGLQRLHRHYEEKHGIRSTLIG